MEKHKLILLLVTNVIIFTVASELTENQEKCYNQVEKAQIKLDDLVEKFEKLSKSAEIPKDGPNTKDIVSIKKLIRKIKRMNKKDSSMPDVILSVDVEKELDEIEKKINIHKIKTNRNDELSKTLDAILKLIKQSGMTLDGITETHNATHRICQDAQDIANNLKTDTDFMNETYSQLEDDYNNVIIRNEELSVEHKELMNNITKIESMINQVKIPQSNVLMYLCEEENQMGKFIDDSMEALGNNVELLEEIAKELNTIDHESIKEVEALMNLINNLNNDVVVVHDALNEYKEAIPMKASLENISKDEIDEIEKNLIDLNNTISNEMLNLDDSYHEKQRMLGVLEFILSKRNLDEVSREIHDLEKYNERIQTIMNSKQSLKSEIEDIRRLAEELMKQETCKRSGSET